MNPPELPDHAAYDLPGVAGPPSSASVTVRYWAGARAAAGTDSDLLPAGTVADVRAEAVRRHPDLAPVAPLCVVLVDGIAGAEGDPVNPGALVEFLPPFAGG
ncbi:MAG: MoaD/ThiS family protein [Tetrasphaera sp.]|jgi:molybdopterin synthase sulfur carrier subunit|nr:MoaD/ThiS family protein [Tetrasphaera sp.]